MDISILEKIEQILQYRIDSLGYKITSQTRQLNNLSDTIKQIYNNRTEAENDTKTDSSIIWLSEYKKGINNILNEYLHQYAKQKNRITGLQVLKIKEHQKKDAINKLSHNTKKIHQTLQERREEDDAEELFITKQYG
ncbi:MAG: hypothetical protein N3B13_03645 [Deltaproteobacteria bacterium]|nr:hypothetical protein [Deltaproteobacteria bacterium]